MKVRRLIGRRGGTICLNTEFSRRESTRGGNVRFYLAEAADLYRSRVSLEAREYECGSGNSRVSRSLSLSRITPI